MNFLNKILSIFKENNNEKEPWHDLYGNPPAELIQNHRIVSRFKRSTIVSYGGSYVLRGNGKLINFLYDAGLGSKNSQGLGMFNIESFPDL